MPRYRFPGQPRFPELPAKNPDREQAWRAIRVLNGMLPQLRYFARNITENPKMEVRVSSEIPNTRGNIISIRPPLGLGLNISHERSLCGDRDFLGRQICKACSLREVVEFFLFHEISHAAFKTQVKPNESDYDLARAYIDEWHPAGACNHGAHLRNQLYVPADCQNLGGLLNQYLPRIHNCLEDARVNARMFDARPGMKRIFDVNIEALMTEGTESGVGKYETWHEAPLDAQFMVGLSIQACGHNLEGKLHPRVVESLADPRIVEICEESPNVGSVHDIFRLTMEAFRVAQELGFCIVEKCKRPDPTPEGKGDPTDSEAGEDDENSDSGQDPSASSGSGTNGDLRDSASSDSGSDPGEADPRKADDGVPDPGSQEPSPGGSASGSDGTGVRSDEGRVPGEPEPATSGGDPGDPDAPADERQESGGDRQGDKDQGNSDGDERNDGSSDGNTDDDDSSREQQSGLRANGDDLDEDDSGDRDSTLQSGVSGDKRDEDDEDEAVDDPEGHGEQADRLEGELPDEEDPSEEGADAPAPVDPANPWDTPGEPTDDTDFEPPSAPVDGLTPPLPERGTIEDIERILAPFMMHGIDDQPGGMLDQIAGGDHEEIVGSSEDGELSEDMKDLIRRAMSQIAVFDDSSGTVSGIEVIKYPCYKVKWSDYLKPEDFATPESILGGAVLRGRRVFSDNKRSHTDRNRTSGRIDTRVLGRRAPLGDPRLFGKKVVPKKKSYFVVIGLDCSLSTNQYQRNPKIKRIAYAQAELLTRLGVPWAGYAHSANTGNLARFPSSSRSGEYYVYILPFKGENEGWNQSTKTKLANIMPISENLDGHTLEFYRKAVEKSTATDKIIIYFTDGKMPLANFAEEKEILEREIAICAKKKITLLGVGINTDSPKKYGMDTVRVDSDEDIIKVVEQLDRRLMAND